MGFSIGNVLKAPFTIPLQIAESVAPAVTQTLRSVAAGSVFMAGQAAATTAAFSGLGILSPAIAMGSAALANNIAFGGVNTPGIMQRALLPGGFAGAATPMIYNAIGAGYPGAAGVPYMAGAGLPAVGQYAPGGMPTSIATAGYNNINSASAAATANAGFMPSGNNGLDLANAIANAPAYSPAEQSLLNQIQDPQQRAMQQLQMFMQKQALLATMLSNLANMRHEMLKTVANNLRA